MVVKAKKHGSVRCRVLNCSNDNLSLVLCRFSTFPVRRNDPECHHQDQVAPFTLGYTYGRRGSFPWPRRILPMAKGWAFLGSGLGPSADIDMGFPVLYPPTIAPQNPDVRLLGRRGGFWWRRAYVTACQVLSFINAEASSFARGTFLVVRHSFSLPTPCSYHFVTRGAPSLRSLYEATQIQRLKTALGIERDLSRL